MSKKLTNSKWTKNRAKISTLAYQGKWRELAKITGLIGILKLARHKSRRELYDLFWKGDREEVIEAINSIANIEMCNICGGYYTNYKDHILNPIHQELERRKLLKKS